MKRVPRAGAYFIARERGLIVNKEERNTHVAEPFRGILLRVSPYVVRRKGK